MNHTEEELERFRQTWRQEVSARQQRTRLTNSSTRPNPTSRGSALTTPGPGLRVMHPSNRIKDDILEPRTFHDVDEKTSKNTGQRLGDVESQSTAARKIEVEAAEKEPLTALEHYERAVEKEGQGNLGDSMGHYRKAFKLDTRVQEKYRQNQQKAAETSGNGASIQPANTTIVKATNIPQALQARSAITKATMELIASFSDLSIQPSDPPTSLSLPPPCPIGEIPTEIMLQIVLDVALEDPASVMRLASVCKRLTYLIFAEDSIWRHLVHSSYYGTTGMPYQFVSSIAWKPLAESFSLPLEAKLAQQHVQKLQLTPKYPTYLSMFKSRPRIRFGGCYISCVNYTRNGELNGSNVVSWNTSPVLIVTYYRYLRFFRDGTCISLCTTAEPGDVVGLLQRENMREAVSTTNLGAGQRGHTRNHSHAHGNQATSQLDGAAASAPPPRPKLMREALRGRWRLTGHVFQNQDSPKLSTAGKEPMGVDEDVLAEEEGEVIIETEGHNDRYTFKMHLAMASAGRGTRNNKLAWKGFWIYNRLTDDWAESLLNHDRPYIWSRVRSYGT